MTFWIILVVLCLAAILFSVWPLWKASHKLSPLVALVIVFTVALSVGMYDSIGSPNVPSGRSVNANDAAAMNDAITSLQARLAENPEDIGGWKMLGRSQAALNNFTASADAYEKAMALEDGKVAQTMVDLAVAILNRDNTQIEGRPASLIESALALDPNNPPALFYSGVAAANRGDTETATSRWQKLLGLNPPDNIRAIIERRLAEWSGEVAPAAAAQVIEPDTSVQDVPADTVVSAQVSLSDEARAAITSDTFVFLIARDPAAPTPPVAVSRLRLSELPKLVSLTDAQSMVAGRELSSFAEIELLARVSLSGGPAAATGDWFGSLLVRPAETRSVSLTIDQQVP